MKVEFFESDNLDTLKSQVNEYIKSIMARYVVKIEYNKVLTHHEYMVNAPYNEFSYSVMIVTERPFEDYETPAIDMTSPWMVANTDTTAINSEHKKV